ncbi:sirohydrochlorin chelatase [Naumannella halotolerans]|uniref:sirohydrochlorin chelatase n=1 Tax=Naumannella halotolerans TaxID=993414 RepID=UPI00370D1B3E
MNAPTLVLLAAGSSDTQVNQVTHAMRVGLQQMRPDLDVQAAFLDHCPPTGPQVVSYLAKSGVKEIAFVPLLLSSPFVTDPRVSELVQRTAATHPQIRTAVAGPIGPEAGLLNQVDAQLRLAVRRRGVSELDGLVLLADGQPDSRGASLLARRARQWGQHHKLPAVPVFTESGPAAVSEAIATLREQGRRHIAVGSLSLSSDQSWLACARQAQRLGAVAIGRPLGADPAVLDLALARYAVAAMDLIDFGFDAIDADAESKPSLSVVG